MEVIKWDTKVKLVVWNKVWAMWQEIVDCITLSMRKKESVDLTISRIRLILMLYEWSNDDTDLYIPIK